MWKCPKCGKEFKNTNQNHYCGKKPENIDEYNNILHFAAAKKHIGFYPGSEAVAEFEQDLKEYQTDKGTIRIPYGSIDTDLIQKIARWCLDTGKHA